MRYQRTVVEEEEHGEAQRGGGQQDETDVAGDHEVAHHQGHFVLVAALLLLRRGRGVVAPAHAPLQGAPPPQGPPRLQGGGEDGPRRAPRVAQGPVGENDGGGVRTEDGDGRWSKERGVVRCVMAGASAVVPAVHRGGDPAAVAGGESRQKAFSGFQATHF